MREAKKNGLNIFYIANFIAVKNEFDVPSDHHNNMLMEKEREK